MGKFDYSSNRRKDSSFGKFVKKHSGKIAIGLGTAVLIGGVAAANQVAVKDTVKRENSLKQSPPTQWNSAKPACIPETIKVSTPDKLVVVKMVLGKSCPEGRVKQGVLDTHLQEELEKAVSRFVGVFRDEDTAKQRSPQEGRGASWRPWIIQGSFGVYGEDQISALSGGLTKAKSYPEAFNEFMSRNEEWKDELESQKIRETFVVTPIITDQRYQQWGTHLRNQESISLGEWTKEFMAARKRYGVFSQQKPSMVDIMSGIMLTAMMVQESKFDPEVVTETLKTIVGTTPPSKDLIRNMCVLSWFQFLSACEPASRKWREIYLTNFKVLSDHCSKASSMQKSNVGRPDNGAWGQSGYGHDPYRRAGSTNQTFESLIIEQYKCLVKGCMGTGFTPNAFAQSPPPDTPIMPNSYAAFWCSQRGADGQEVLRSLERIVGDDTGSKSPRRSVEARHKRSRGRARAKRSSRGRARPKRTRSRMRPKRPSRSRARRKSSSRGHRHSRRMSGVRARSRRISKKRAKNRMFGFNTTRISDTDSCQAFWANMTTEQGWTPNNFKLVVASETPSGDTIGFHSWLEAHQYTSEPAWRGLADSLLSFDLPTHPGVTGQSIFGEYLEESAPDPRPGSLYSIGGGTAAMSKLAAFSQLASPLNKEGVPRPVMHIYGAQDKDNAEKAMWLSKATNFTVPKAAATMNVRDTLPEVLHRLCGQDLDKHVSTSFVCGDGVIDTDVLGSWCDKSRSYCMLVSNCDYDEQDMVVTFGGQKSDWVIAFVVAETRKMHSEDYKGKELSNEIIRTVKGLGKPDTLFSILNFLANRSLDGKDVEKLFSYGKDTFGTDYPATKDATELLHRLRASPQDMIRGYQVAFGNGTST